MSVDKAQQVRDEDRLDVEKITHFLEKNLSGKYLENLGSKKIEILQFPGGASNLTYEIKLKDISLILRTSPQGANIKGAHDMGREFNVLSKLQDHFSYCPKPLAYSDDKDILGRSFYLMEKIEGFIPRRDMPVKLDEEELKQLCENLVSIHAQLHAVDIEATGLISLGKPEGYVNRQLTGWCGRYEKARTEDVPSGKKVMKWLLDNQPEDSYATAAQASFIHNDYKFDNVVLDKAQPTNITAVLDWEMATIGDPFMDLGCAMAYWVEAGDSEELKMIRMMPTTLNGMMTREQVVDFYLQESSKDMPNFNYYYVFGLFRLAVIAQQIYKRYKERKTTNKRFAGFGKICSILILECKKYF